jgi:uncharacterized SAM-binding protein YcdF (DUF218 family)
LALARCPGGADVLAGGSAVSEQPETKPAERNPTTVWHRLRARPWRLLMAAACLILLVCYSPAAVAYVAPRPMLWFWFAIALGILGLWRRRPERRGGLVLLTVGFALLTLYFMPLNAYWLSRALEAKHPPIAHRPKDVQAIVVLAGGLRAPDAQGLPFQPSESTLYRCLRGLEMYRQGPPCPVFVSGGRISPENADPSCAQVMRDFLEHSGVASADLVVEEESQSTYENAVATARLLKERGIRKILLVTDGLHLHRAVLCFEAQGLEVVPCGCSYRARALRWSATELMPTTHAAQGVRAALYEYVALLVYTWQGRI